MIVKRFFLRKVLSILVIALSLHLNAFSVFGQNEKFYVAARYNTISGKQLESAIDNLEISRLNFAGGWYISKNILTKLEYLKQSYDGKGWTGRFAGAEFSGVMLEAVISF